MPKLINNPDFTSDEGVETEETEEKEIAPKEGAEETETPPKEASTEETKAGEEEQPEESEDFAALEKQEEKLKGENSELAQKLQKKREDIVEQRRIRRENKKAFAELDTGEESVDDDLSGIDPADVKQLEKVLNAKGYKPASEIQKQAFKDAQVGVEEDFFKSHPEYIPENDEGDVLYDALTKELQQFAKPASIAQIKTIFNKAHSLVKEQYPNRFPKKTSPADTAAQRQKLKTAGIGAGSHGSPAAQTKTSKVTKEVKDRLLAGGWTEEEIAEM